MHATGFFDDGTTQDLTGTATWTSTQTAQATVTSPGGLATAVSSGSPTIQASQGGASGSTSLTISSAAIIGISVRPNNATLGAGNQTLQYHAIAEFSDGTSQDVTSSANWSSSATGSATITSPGGLASSGSTPGNVTISATVSGLSNSTGLTVVTVAQFVYAANFQGTDQAFQLNSLTGALTAVSPHRHPPTRSFPPSILPDGFSSP